MTLDEMIKNAKVDNSLFSQLSDSDIAFTDEISKIAIMIYDERNRMGMSQKNFAKFMGVNQSMVSKWEGAECNFSLETLFEIFDKLNFAAEIKITKKMKSHNKNLSNQHAAEYFGCGRLTDEIFAPKRQQRPGLEAA